MEANRLADNWLSIHEAEARDWYNHEANRDSTYVHATGQGGKGQSVSACMKGLGVASGDQLAKVRELEEAQRFCLYNVVPEDGYADRSDPSLHMPFNWKWKGSNWQTPPKDWKIPERPADTGQRVRIKSVSNSQYIAAPEGVSDNQWVSCRGCDAARLHHMWLSKESPYITRSGDPKDRSAWWVVEGQ